MEDYRLDDFMASVSGDKIEILMYYDGKFNVEAEYPKSNFASTEQALDRFFAETQCGMMTD